MKVYDFSSITDDWEPKGTKIIGEANDDEFGFNVSLSSNGNILAVGAYGNDGCGNESGHVRVDEFFVDSWSQ